MITRPSRLVLIAAVSLGSLVLVGCPPPREHVCQKLTARRPPGPQSDADFTKECETRLRAMSSGEYGACSQCIVDGVTPERLGECRQLCKGMEHMIPAAPAAVPVPSSAPAPSP